MADEYKNVSRKLVKARQLGQNHAEDLHRATDALRLSHITAFVGGAPDKQDIDELRVGLDAVQHFVDRMRLLVQP
jgi:hypothetical protein